MVNITRRCPVCGNVDPLATKSDAGNIVMFCRPCMSVENIKAKYSDMNNGELVLYADALEKQVSLLREVEANWRSLCSIIDSYVGQGLVLVLDTETGVSISAHSVDDKFKRISVDYEDFAEDALIRITKALLKTKIKE